MGVSNMWIWEEMIKILIFAIYSAGILIIGYFVKECLLPFSKLKKKADKGEATGTDSRKSWMWSGILIALAFSSVFLGINAITSETIKSLPFLYFTFGFYYAVFFIVLHCLYWTGKWIFGDKLNI